MQFFVVLINLQVQSVLVQTPKAPSDAISFYNVCRIEFPYPKDTPFKEKGAVAKASTSPEYKFRCVVPVNPKDKSYKRVYKRQSVKVEVWSKAGFLRSDTLVGTAAVKLQPLEEACEVKEEAALMDGRRPVGGKVDVRVRLRAPIVTPQVEKVEVKCVVIKYT